MSTEKESTHSIPTPVSRVAGKTTLPLPLPALLVLGAILLVAVVLIAPSLSAPSNTTITNTTSSNLVTEEIPIPPTIENHTLNLELMKNTLSKEKFLKKLFSVDRESYDLYEKAAQHLGVTLEEVKQFFYNCCDLINEEDIFSELPSVPEDFPSVAYDVSQGKLYQIGLLDERYYKQPEFYTFIDLETGVVNREYSMRPWSQPQLNQWGDNGMQSYPAEQFDTLSLSTRQTFSAVVFVTNAWNIQNWVGIHLVSNAEALKYFDVTISEESTGQPYFLLGPTFPRFSHDWATKVVIEGKVKPGTPPGKYVIGINPVAPDTKLSQKWSEDHPGLYAPYGFIRPTDNYINLTIDVTP